MHSDNVVRYAPEISDKAEKIEEDYEEESFYTDPGLRENTEEIIASVEKISLRACDEAFFSNDRKYLCAHDGDMAYIIDTAAGELIRTLKLTDEECLGMRYSELAKGYIIDTVAGSFILDRDFNIISEADRIVGEDEKGFIVRDDWFDYYRLPFISPEALEEELAEREKPKA